MVRTVAEDEDKRPYWVKALDNNMVHTSRPEDWNRSVASSMTNNTNSRSHKNRQDGDKHKILKHGGTNEKPRKRRGKSEGGDAQGDYFYGAAYPGMLYRGHSPDTSSVGSRRTTSSARRDRKRSRMIALFFILLIIAFILAAFLGWLTYYLLMRDRPNKEGSSLARNSTRTLEVDASLRILNETFNSAMSNTSSPHFLRIAEPVCQEVNSFFMSSNYSGSYMDCAVKIISKVSDTPGCKCVWSNDGNLLVDFTLTFNGSHGLDLNTLRWHVYDVINRGTTKHFLGEPGRQLVYVLLRQFLVDIRTNWDSGFDGVEAKLTIPVFNLNYTYTLEDRNSIDFRRIATPFCADVRRILTNRLRSSFADRYHTCYVTDFSPGPDSITFHIQFLGREWRQLQKELIFVIIDGAAVATVQSQTVRLIGPLIVTPYKIGFTIRPINVTRIETTTETPATTISTTTMPDLTYIYVVFETWNQTLTSPLLDPGSKDFKIITDEFCVDLERMFDNSIYGYRFYNCRVLAFRRNPTSIVVSVGYVGGPWPGMGTSVEYVIRRHAPGYYYERKELFLVGSLYLILGNVIANATELRTNLRVLNLTFTPDLADQRTSRFQYHALLFCRDMQKYYSRSVFAERFFECGVDSFSDDPVRIHFYLVFYGTDMDDGVVRSVPRVIRRFAPPVYYLVYLTYRVGDLLVLPEKRPGVDPSPSVYPTNITVLPSTLKPTATMMTTTDISSTHISPSSSYIETPNGLLLILYYEVYNLTFTTSLMYPTSPDFVRHRDAVCDDLWRWYMGRDSPFISIYRACDVTSFTRDPVGVTFTLLFETRMHDTFITEVRNLLEYKAPKVYVPKLILLDVGHLLLIMDRYSIKVSSASVTATTLRTPTLTSTVSVMTTSMDMTPTMTLTPSTTTVIPSSTVDIGSILSYKFGLADFIYTVELTDPGSNRFRFLMEGFCEDMDRYYRQSFLQNFYVSCKIDAFRERPNEDYAEWVYFSFQFNTEMFYEIQEEANRILFSKPPRVPMSGYWTLKIGDLYLIIGPYDTELPETPTNSPSYTLAVTTLSTTDQIIPTPTSPAPSSIITSPTTPSTSISTETTYFIRISFQTMNLTYTDALNDETSGLYKFINRLFCSDIDRILRDRLDLFPTYMQCQIDVFSGDPPRVNFSLQFQDLRGVDRSTVKENAISMIIENARREDYMGWYALLIGNLLISMDGITVDFTTVPTTPNIYSAIGYNYTFYMYQGNYTQQLSDKNSPLFKERAYLFCQDVDNIFQMSGLRNVKKRYHGCVVDEFRPNLEVKFRVILRDIDIVRVSTMFSIFAYHGEQVTLDGVSYLILGGIYVTFDADPAYGFLILETFTTHPYPYTTTTPSVEYSVITLTLSILSPDYTADLRSVSSARYRLLAGSFCSDISTWLSSWSSVDYYSCEDVTFQQFPYTITAQLRFVGTLSVMLQYNMYTIIMEEAARVYSGGLLGSQIGDVLVSYASVLDAQSKVMGGVRTSPRTTTQSTPPLTSPGSPETTTVFEPCLLNPNAKTVLHPTRCDGFYTCANGVAFFVDCTSGWVVQGDTCVPEPPGYVCQK